MLGAAVVEKSSTKQMVSPKKELLSPSTSTKFRINRSRNSSREKVEKITMSSAKKSKAKEEVKIGELMGEGNLNKIMFKI